MPSSPNLGIAHVQDTLQPEIEANAAIDLLDQAMNDTVDIAVTGDVTVTATQFTQNLELNFTGSPGVPFDVFLPASKRLFASTNNTGQTGTVGVDDGVGGFLGLTVDVADGQSFILYSDGTDVVAVGGGAGGLSDIKDEGITAVTPVSSIDFVGQGVQVSDAGSGQATVNIPGVPLAVYPGAPFFGALCKPTSDTAAVNLTSVTVLTMQTAIHQTKYNGFRFHLGANATVTADASTDEITLTAHDFKTGDGPFEFTNSGGALPTGLSASTQYWAIVTGPNTFKVAVSLANALAGTNVDITSAGTGTHTCLRGNRLVVPPGVTKVRLTGQVYLQNFGSGDYALRIDRNGSSTGLSAGMPQVSLRGSEIFGDDSVNLTSGVLSVTPGDWFRTVINIQNDTSVDVKADGTWMALEVIETDADASVALAGTPGPWRFISKETLSAVASKQIESFNDGRDYASLTFLIRDLSSGTDDWLPRLRLKLNGSYKIDAFYGTATETALANDTTDVAGANATSGMFITATGSGNKVGNATGESLSGYVTIDNPFSTTRRKHLRWAVTWTRPDGTTMSSFGGGEYKGTDHLAALEGLQIDESGGATLTGEVLVFGVLAENPVASPGGTPGPLRFLASYDLTGLSSKEVTDFVGVANLTHVQLRISGVTVSVDDSEVNVQLRKNSSLKTANYQYALHYKEASGTNNSEGNSSTTRVPMVRTVSTGSLGNAANENGDFVVDIPEPNSARVHQIRTRGEYAQAFNGFAVGCTSSGRYTGTDLAAAIDGIVILPDSGTFNSGTLEVWGLISTEPGTPYNIPGEYIPSTPTSSQIILSHIFTRDVNFLTDMAGSQFLAQVAATASTVFDIQKNGVSIGSATFAAAGTSATFSVSPAVSFTAGNRLQVIAPSSADATLADLDLNLAGETPAVV